MNRRELIAAGVAAGVLGLRSRSLRARQRRPDLTLGFVGDLLSDRERPAEAYEAVRDLLSAPDILFGNLEGPYSNRPQTVPSSPIALVPSTHNIDVFGEVGFDVLSLANNHIVDGGHRALLETLERLEEQGLLTCGAGGNLAEARAPAIAEAGASRIAYLAYASVFPKGYEARPGSPGLAPLRAHNFYRDSIDDYYTPGADPRVSTVPDEADHDNLAADIAAAREQADLVVTSFHWGDHFKAYHLSDHEPRTARFCIDRGVDIVVGHHQHLLRGIEWYRGKPIFYGLGHFVFDLRLDKWPKWIVEAMPLLDDSSDFYGVAKRAGWPLNPLHRESRMTAMAFVNVESGAITDVGFVPCRLDPDGGVRAVDPESEEGREVVEYVEKGCVSQELNGRVDRSRYADVAGHRGVFVRPVD